jgi:hypothetical protein
VQPAWASGEARHGDVERPRQGRLGVQQFPLARLDVGGNALLRLVERRAYRAPVVGRKRADAAPQPG